MVQNLCIGKVFVSETVPDLSLFVSPPREWLGGWQCGLLRRRGGLAPPAAPHHRKSLRISLSASVSAQTSVCSLWTLKHCHWPFRNKLPASIKLWPCHHCHPCIAVAIVTFTQTFIVPWFLWHNGGEWSVMEHLWQWWKSFWKQTNKKLI